MSDQRRQALMQEYSEALNNFRLLTEIRFKLLTNLPAATILTFALSQDKGGAYVFVIGAFGLAITIALVTYNARNDQLYDELIRRAASIERSLDLADGTFANRPRHWLTIRLPGFKWRIDHRASIGLIYGASAVLWLFLLLMPVLDHADLAYLHLSLPHLSVADPEPHIKMLAFALATIVTALAAYLVIHQNNGRQGKMIKLAKCAVERAVGLVQSTEPARIGGKHDDIENLVKQCAELSQLEDSVVRARARFYTAKDTEEMLARYLPPNSKKHVASQFVALLTDLTPEYLLDCYTDRMGMAEALKQRSAAKESRSPKSRARPI